MLFNLHKRPFVVDISKFTFTALHAHNKACAI